MPYYSVNRDDNDLRVVTCPSCSTPEAGQADVTIFQEERVPYKAEGYLLNLMQCNTCGVYFSFYTEDGIRKITKVLARKGLKQGHGDMQADGTDGHGHSYYVIFKQKPPTITTKEYYDLLWAKEDKSYNKFKRWHEDLPSINDLIKLRQFFDNVDFAKMDENYLKPHVNAWFKLSPVENAGLQDAVQ